MRGEPCLLILIVLVRALIKQPAGCTEEPGDLLACKPQAIGDALPTVDAQPPTNVATRDAKSLATLQQPELGLRTEPPEAKAEGEAVEHVLFAHRARDAAAVFPQVDEYFGGIIGQPPCVGIIDLPTPFGDPLDRGLSVCGCHRRGNGHRQIFSDADQEAAEARPESRDFSKFLLVAR